MTALDPTLPPERVEELAEAQSVHRVNYHQRNIGGETAATLRYTSCEGCDWLGGWHDESGWEGHLARDVIAPLVAGWLAEAEVGVVREAVPPLVDAAYERGAAEVREQVEAVIDRGKRTVHGRLALADDLRAALATNPEGQP